MSGSRPAPWRGTLTEAVQSARNRVNRGLTRTAIILLVDALLVSGGLYLAVAIRHDFQLSEQLRQALPTLFALLIGARLLVNVLFSLHRWSFRLSGLNDATRVILAGLAGSALFWLLLVTVPGVTRQTGAPYGLPRSILLLEFNFTTALMGISRFGPRLALIWLVGRSRRRRHSNLRTIIVGAGATGEQLARDLDRSDEHRYQVIGFVDDDVRKKGMIICGKPVLGTLAGLPDLTRRHRLQHVLLAIPLLPSERIRELLTLCSDLRLTFKTLPVSFVHLGSRSNAASLLEDLSTEDLLFREAVCTATDPGPAGLSGRRVLVTGAAGSIGSEICRQLLRGGVADLVMVDVEENGLYLSSRRFEREYPQVTIQAVVASVRDAPRMRRLLETVRPQDVFHAAAHKHVPLMEVACEEAVKNNIQGTANVARAADAAGVERFCFISTDKAVRPTSVMGTSKRVAEMVVRDLARRSATRCSVVRFGNVLGSAGSVVPIFKEQIARGGPVTVTHPEVRRYFMTISEAVRLVLVAAYGNFGPLCVLDMGRPIRIVDLARHMIILAGCVPGAEIPILFTGLRPGEKMTEELLTEEEEESVRVSDKILVAKCPPPPDDLAARLGELAAAAEAGDRDEIRRLFRMLVPTYHDSQATGGGVDAHPAAAVPVAMP